MRITGHASLAFVLKSSKVILSTLTFLLIAVSKSQAYDDGAHRQIIVDAVQYILDEKNNAGKYVDNSSGSTDYALLRQVFAPSITDHQDAEKAIKESAETLAESSVDTDRLEDVWLQIPGFKVSPRAPSGTSYTVFSHFLNVHQKEAIWPSSGYYYGWVNLSPCTSKVYHDKLTNAFVGKSGAKYITNVSETFLKYKMPRKNDITDQDYFAHFNQDIEHIHFWPITNLASYYYDAFAHSPSTQEGVPLNLPHLGPVLHAAADTTVPFHAVGLSGCGHFEYEKNVERWYWKKAISFYSSQQVREYLTKIKYLSAQSTLDKILIGNALRASERNCKCGLTGCECQIVNNDKVAKRLVNLAIASTVVVIRKSLLEWSNNKTTSQLQFTSSPKGKVFSKTLYFDDWSAVPVREVNVTSENSGHADAVNFQLTNNFKNIKMTVGEFSKGQIKKDEFRNNYLVLIKDSVDIGANYSDVEWEPSGEASVEKYPGMPRVGPPPQEYRLPTLDETQDEAKWKAYCKESKRFYNSLEFVELATQSVKIGTKIRLGNEAGINKQIFLEKLNLQLEARTDHLIYNFPKNVVASK